MSSHVFSLTCIDCESTLQGLNGDMTFTCSSCSLAYSITEKSLQKYPMVLRAPEDAKTKDGLWLPFWELQCNPEIVAEHPDRLNDYELPSQIDVFVKGFSLTNVSKIGNPGLFLTQKGADPCQPTPTPQPSVVGARRPVDVAKAYAELFLLELLDRQADIEGISITLNISRIRFAGIFFEDHGDVLKCPATNRTYPAGLVDDIVAIRDARS